MGLWLWLAAAGLVAAQRVGDVSPVGVADVVAAAVKDVRLYFGPPVTDGLVLHLAADAIEGAADGERVAQWDDGSGYSNHVAQASEAARPVFRTNIINGLPTVRFDGTTTLLADDAPSLDIDSTISILVVARPIVTDGGHRRIVIKGHSGWSEPYYMYAMWLYLSELGGGICTAGARRWATFNGGLAAGTPALLALVYDRSYLNFRVDGDLIGQLAETRAININDQPLRIGGTPAAPGNTWFIGDIAEILVFNRNLAASELTDTERYLGEKWLGWIPPMPPQAPGPPVYSEVAATTLFMTWDAPADGPEPDGYRLQRAPDTGGSPGAFDDLAMTAGRFFTDIGLTPETAYWYRVTASNAVGFGPAGDPAVVTTAAARVWFDAAWAYRQRVTIDSNQVADALTNFAVYLDLADFGSDFFEQVLPDGADVIVTDEYNSLKLKRELVAIDTVGETGELHFLAPLVAADTHSVYYLYYGHAAAAETNQTAVWDATYQAVWHMADGPGNTIPDSTIHGHHGSKKGAGEPLEADARLGRGQAFDGSDDLVAVAQSSALDIDGPLTVSAWIRPATVSGNRAIYSEGGDGSGNGRGYALSIENGKLHFMHRTSGSSHVVLSDGPNLAVDAWQHVAVTVEDTAVTFYLDGARNGNIRYLADGLRSSVTDSPSFMGAVRTGFWYYQGLIDEIRVAARILGEADLAAQFNNQAASATFYGVGIRENEP